MPNCNGARDTRHRSLSSDSGREAPCGGLTSLTTSISRQQPDLTPLTIHGKGTFVLLGICHFNGCDVGASATVGVVPLCALHQSYVLTLMDRRVDGAAEDDVIVSDIWSLLSGIEGEI